MPTLKTRKACHGWIASFAIPKNKARTEVLAPVRAQSSPYKSEDRTFRAVFQLTILPRGSKPGKTKPARTYRNPIFLAREWQKALVSGEYASQTAMARKLGVSRVRVTQVLNLLRLSASTIDRIASLGDPLSSQIVTERKLRPLVPLPEAEQNRRTEDMVKIPLKMTIGEETTISEHRRR
jgi:transcriptional regulator with XRE-family HTH domain